MAERSARAALWAGFAVLVACSNAVTGPTGAAASVAGTWQVQQPSGWTDFRFTLTQTACTRAAATDPCVSTITGSATSTPAVCQVVGMQLTNPFGMVYTCDVVAAATGRVVADDVTLNFAKYADGTSTDYAGRVAGDGSVFGDLTFRDFAGVVHHIGPCTPGPVCLDYPGQLDFVRGGTPVAAVTR